MKKVTIFYKAKELKTVIFDDYISTNLSVLFYVEKKLVAVVPSSPNHSFFYDEIFIPTTIDDDFTNQLKNIQQEFKKVF